MSNFTATWNPSHPHLPILLSRRPVLEYPNALWREGAAAPGAAAPGATLARALWVSSRDAAGSAAQFVSMRTRRIRYGQGAAL
jgi:hypothetical protein